MVSYKPLLKTLLEKDMTKTELRLAADFSTVTLAKIKKNEPITLTIIEKICSVLDCRIEDVIEFVPETEHEQH